MGKRSLPPLRRNEIIAIFHAAGLRLEQAARNNRHDKYIGIVKGQNRSVPLSRSHDEFCDWELKSIIKQSGMTKIEFYGMTEATAAKLQCTFLVNGLPAIQDA